MRTSSVFVAEVGEAPDVSEADGDGNAGEEEVEFVSPAAALVGVVGGAALARLGAGRTVVLLGGRLLLVNLLLLHPLGRRSVACEVGLVAQRDRHRTVQLLLGRRPEERALRARHRRLLLRPNKTKS